MVAMGWGPIDMNDEVVVVDEVEDQGSDSLKDQGAVVRFGTGGGATAKSEGEAKQRWWPSCIHSRWTKLDRTKFKDRIVILKECRKCGKKKSEVIYRNLNSRNVYTARDSFDVPQVVTEEPE